MYREEVELARELVQQGHSYGELVRMASAGTLYRLRRGSYVREPPTSAEKKHRQLIVGSLAALGDGAVVSHVSAALLWGLPTWDRDLDRVHVVRDRNAGGRTGSLVHVHPVVLPPAEITTVDGIAVTSLARTVADCARVLPYAFAVALGDAALHAGLTHEELWPVLRRKPRRVGNPQARRVAQFLDPRSESVGESISRVRMADFGLPAPELQFEVIDPDTGEVVARCDFGWPELRTVGEFDGEVKYGRLLKPGQTSGDAVFEEKIREDRIRDLRHSVVRWVYDDLWRFEPTAARLRRAFARRSHLT